MSYEPIITPGRNFFLVSTEYKESCSAWCRKQIGTTLRTCQGRIIIIDATGEYANLALDHDRLIREKIPSIIYRYKLVDGKPYIAHVIEVDTEANEAPRLIVYDISRTIIISWKVGVEAIDKILQSYAVMQDSEIAWLYVPLDLYTKVKPESESWNILERTIKGNEGKLMTVLTTRKFTIGMVQHCLHMTKNKLLEDSK